MAESTPIGFLGLPCSPDTPVVSMQQHPAGQQPSKFTLLKR